MHSIPNTTSTTMPIDRLDLSRFNVRTNRDDVATIAAIEASILECGLIHPLNVHPLAGSKRLGVFAGGRRYRSIKNLVKRGDLPADYAVKVSIYEGFTDAQIIEKSLGENMLRLDLREYEICAAAARLARTGETPDAIAQALGQRDRDVRQWIRVGELAPEIFAALEQGSKKGGIDIEEAQAYAATADRALQSATFAELMPLPDWQRGPSKIRAALKVGDAHSSRRLRLVGADAYREAGGRFELDLFAGEAEQRGRVVDEGLLAQLADARLEEVRAGTRASTGRADLRFIAAPPKNNYGGTDDTLRASPKARDGGGLTIPEGAVAWIDVNEAGEPQVSYWWESRKAKASGGTKAAPKPLARPERAAGAAIDDRASPGATQQANEEIKEETGITPATIQIFRSLRRVIMRAMFVRDGRKLGTVGLDYLVWAQLRMMLRPERHNAIGMQPIGELDVDSEEAREEIRATEASREWRDALYELSQQTFITDDDLDDAFLDYRCSGSTLKHLAAATVAGMAVARSLNGGTYRLPIHDAVAAELPTADDATIRSLWTPSATLLERIPAHQRLAIADPFVERVTFGAWQRLKSAELTRRVHDLVLGRGDHAKPAAAEAARTWVHPLLQFAPPEHAGADGDPGPANDAAILELAEMAE